MVGVHEQVRVESVLRDSPADKSGLKADDVIEAIDGIALNDDRAARVLIRSRSPGTTLKLTVLRKKSEIKIDVVLAERPNLPLPKPAITNGDETGWGTEIFGEGSREILNGFYEITKDENLLEIEIGPPPDRVCLDVSDRVTLAGTLRVIAMVYTPKEGDRYVLIESGKEIKGKFKRLELPDLPKGLQWKIDYNEHVKAGDAEHQDKIAVSLSVTKA